MAQMTQKGSVKTVSENKKLSQMAQKIICEISVISEKK